MPFGKPNIDEGIELMLEVNKKAHRGYGYNDFIKMYVDAGANVNNLAKIFKVQRNTFDKWVKRYKAEQAKADKKLELDSK